VKAVRREGLGKAEEEMMNGKGEWGYSASVVGGKMSSSSSSSSSSFMRMSG